MEVPMKRNIESNAKSTTRNQPTVKATTITEDAARDVAVVSTTLVSVSAPHINREQLIAEAAYHHAEARSFEPGHELEDWLAAEAEVDARLCSEGCVY
jgi:Protein of unknown function (DUF2934)